MTLPAYPPRYAAPRDLYAPITRGERGWRVYALQMALGFTSAEADGDFGPHTEAAVKAYQAKIGLSPVGYAGPQTQLALLLEGVKYAEKKRPELRKGVLKGFLIYEGGSLLAPTNWYTPPGGKPGVDCGPVQWRQYGPPFDMAGLKLAFRPGMSFLYAADALLDRIKDANRRNAALTDDQVLKGAILAHNWPAGFEQIIKYGHIANPGSLALWTTKPGGGHYTRGEWSVEYPRRILSAGTL